MIAFSISHLLAVQMKEEEMVAFVNHNLTLKSFQRTAVEKLT